jgi:putative spermidine/putrescine transport system substrate-binding protein
MWSMSARIAAVLLSVIVVGLAAGPAARPASAAIEIVFLTWGGVYQDLFRPIAADFEKATGIKVTFAVQGSAKDGLSKLMTQKENPQVDVWTSNESPVKVATDSGLLAQMSPEKIPNLRAVPRQFVTPTGAALWLSPRGIIYRADQVPFEPKRWEDLWDARLKSKIGVSFPIDTGSFLIMAALINGGSERNIEPGFEKAKALQPNIAVFYKTDPESIKLLEAGEIGVAGFGILANIYTRLGGGSPYRFVIPEKPQFLPVIPVSIVKGRGAEREEASAKFVNHLLSKEVQERLAAKTGTVPANASAQPAEGIRAVVPPLTNVYLIDWDVVNANYNQWEDRWNREIQRR